MVLNYNITRSIKNSTKSFQQFQKCVSDVKLDVDIVFRVDMKLLSWIGIYPEVQVRQRLQCSQFVPAFQLLNLL